MVGPNIRHNVPAAAVGVPLATAEVTNNEVTSQSAVLGAKSTTIVLTSASATGRATSPNMNNSEAKQTATSAAIGVTLHLGLSLIVSILSWCTVSSASSPIPNALGELCYSLSP